MTKTGDPRFYQRLDELAELHDRKSRDYDKPGQPLSNHRRCEDIGVPAFVGALIRMMDKWERITNLTRKLLESGEGPAVTNESLVDTLMDNAAYSIIVMNLLEDYLNGKEKHGDQAGGIDTLYIQHPPPPQTCDFCGPQHISRSHTSSR